MTVTLPTPDAPLRIGTRGSPLALAQAHETRNRLAQAFDLKEKFFSIVVIKVTGDAIQDRALKDIGGKGLFTREIEEDLLSGKIDIAVHSTKDMPTLQPDGLILDTFLPREDVRDAFVSPKLSSIAELASGAVVGTSSLRRKAQLLHRRPDLKVVEFRGNVQTRLKKLADGVAECTFLAAAGLSRLGMDDVPATPVEPDDMLPAIAQGAIGIERRMDDANTAEMLMAIHDVETGQRLAAERSLLLTLDGSCETPIAGLAELNGCSLRLRGQVLRPDGSQALDGEREGSIEEAAAMGKDLGEELLSRAGPGFFDWHTS
ncbi:hydroxymethylbilane synthase [uncultured Roseobacter sp.]|uniref:hydroxymethylbilane synthase n=1 Tax=uncultured Roseobacter sp. TaxID=114847 RepID=UPI0026250628|nr:hydroxymethylbilane synthase [uncultured Roseobacter sp.]